MATTKTSVIRTDDSSGDDFLTYDIPTGEKAQGMVIVDENGAHAGITGTPIVTSVSGTVTVSGTVAATVAVGTDYSSGGTAVDSAVIKASAGVLRELRCIMIPSASNARYLMLFDADSLPITPGTAPVWRMLVPAGGEAGESFPLGLDFSTGITAALSSSADTLTVTTANECYIHALTE